MYPTLFEIPRIGRFGPFPIHSFGVMMVIAFASAMWFAKSRAPRFGIPGSKILDASFWMLVAGILGARIVFILQSLPYYLEHTDKLFSLQFEGLTSFGGLIFGLVALIVWGRRERIPLLKAFDTIAPAFLVGHFFGRIGCFLNGCCYGASCPADAPFATQFFGLPGFHQPAQLYEAAMTLVGLGIVLTIERRGLRSGQVTGLVLIAYGTARFIYEFWRAGTPAQVEQGLASSTTIGNLPITEGHVMALLVVIAGVVWFVLARRNRPEFDAAATGDDTPSSQEPLPA